MKKLFGLLTASAILTGLILIAVPSSNTGNNVAVDVGPGPAFAVQKPPTA